MSKILIVNQVMEGYAKLMKDSNIFDKSEGYFNITPQYQKAGGKKDNQVLILSEPENVNPSQIKTPTGMAANWSVPEVLEKIVNISPDLVLLNTSIPCSCPKEIIDLWVKNYVSKQKNPLKLKNHQPEYSDEAHYLMPSVEGDSNFTDQYLLTKSGGICIGYELNKMNLPFSLCAWDYGDHGRPYFEKAYVLDLVSSEEILSLDAKVPTYNEIINLRKNNNFHSDDFGVDSSTNGSLILWNHFIFNENETGLSRKGVTGLDKVINYTSLNKK